METTEQYALYKGLQRPLVFKMFKGKFIYWAAAIIVGGVLIAGITTAVISSIIGLVVLFVITVPGLLWVVNKQKEGLHSKKMNKGVFIYPPVCRMLKSYAHEEKNI
ncbi:MAG TPA: hypothetical protein VFQ86_09335 [Arachidicoccus soli]|uniref:Plasmid transfer protein n=1 Tax=Arachidicoccus soli TaxID=2341117 RepID=A0A386HTP0_9BACT|nr:plasmid transfer protein [Arachidicoccus soli]AYD49039.1 plasmid transfer protein [Arachidicoccus soli]HEU0227929.1 hypothetical protein [Arachidicoccus soli]